ncbi:MAG: hypothetical protein V1718_05365 [archaeon]
MKEKYDGSDFEGNADDPDDRNLQVLIAIANELAELNTRIWELKEEIGKEQQKKV